MWFSQLPSYQANGSRTSIYGDRLSGLDAFGGNASPQHGRNTVFAGDDRAMAEGATDIGNHTHGQGK
jgi:hypothetical protein